MPYVFQSLSGAIGDFAGTPADLRAVAVEANRLALAYWRNAAKISGWFRTKAGANFPCGNLADRLRADALNREAICLDARAASLQTFGGTPGEVNAHRSAALTLRNQAREKRTQADNLIARLDTQVVGDAVTWQNRAAQEIAKAERKRGEAAQALAQADAAARTVQEKIDNALAQAAIKDAEAAGYEALIQEKLKPYYDTFGSDNAAIERALRVSGEDVFIANLQRAANAARSVANSKRAEADRLRRTI